ncbi:MAG: LLM class flavin-dependent oxidoreductase [Gammaproteobacteria bacterium]|nr:LLM class flavin-dependent oxidoreductase [Gammaproteobacteria bacterium]MYF31494.1 LLM class flavin-dependent oxidoreductase [Gammaproteobacteria bacterium]MYK46841.1 LLM class flavin-dependent oxidoreductase [Gammaproteobacteria bacterium]
MVLQTDPPARRVVELAQRAEVYGFTHVWVYDSPVLWQEPFVILARILAETEKVTLTHTWRRRGEWTTVSRSVGTVPMSVQHQDRYNGRHDRHRPAINLRGPRALRRWL